MKRFCHISDRVQERIDRVCSGWGFRDGGYRDVVCISHSCIHISLDFWFLAQLASRGLRVLVHATSPFFTVDWWQKDWRRRFEEASALSEDGFERGHCRGGI